MTVKWKAVIFCFILTLYGCIDCTKPQISTGTSRVCTKITSYMQSYQETYVDSYQILINEPCGIFGMRTCTRSRTEYRLSERNTYTTAYHKTYSCCEGWKPMDGGCKPICDPKCVDDQQCVSPNNCEALLAHGLNVQRHHEATRLKRDNPNQDDTGGESGSGNGSGRQCNLDYCCSNSECYTRGRGQDYRGNLSITISGTQCQNWTSQSLFTMETFPTSGLGDHNFCRNPGNPGGDGDFNSPWCFTIDKGISWEPCDVGTQQPTCSAKGTNCYARSRGRDYRGSVSYTEYSKHCQSWTLQNTFKLQMYGVGLGDHNYCRNPGDPEANSNPGRPWCYIMESDIEGTTWEPCNVGEAQPTCSTEDLNEYATYNDICDVNAICDNTVGSFTCVCNDGYRGDGFTCTDIDECTRKNGNCNVNAMCYNTVGSLTCTCNDGYSGDGFTCTDINECATNNDNCNVNATCDNTAGSFKCICNDGYSGDGFTCTDINECATNNDNCNVNATCNNTAGSFKCICNDGYSGDGFTCTGKCLADTSKSLTNLSVSWPETNAGVRAESIERCPVNSENRTLALANRECTLNGTWARIEDNQCGGYAVPSVDELLETPTTENNVEDVAKALSNITKSSGKMIDIEGVQMILSNIFNVKSSSPEVTMLVIGAISDIIDANITEGMFPVNASSKILQNVERQIERTLRKTGQFKAVTRNLAAEGVAFNNTQFKNGIGFGLSRGDVGLSDTDINDPSKNQDEGTSSIQVPIDALFGNDSDTDTQVSFVAHNGDKLFQSEAKTENETILGPVISAVVLGKDVKGLESQVVVKIVPYSKNPGITMNTSRCVYWDFNLRAGVGDWAEDGCVLMAADSEGVTCHCNHLTNFAVLVDFSGQTEPGTLTFALDIISKIGCAFSIGALCLTLMIFILSSRLRISLQRKILIQFCISMLCLYLAFLLGIDSGTNAGCTAATFLLHYFVLTTVFWMGVEARHMYITLVSKSDRVGRKFMKKAGLFAWGAALIPVGVVLGVKWDAYQADGYCFIVPDYGLYFGLLLPVGLVVLHNVATFVFVAKKLLSSKLYVVKKDLAAGASPTDVKEIAQRMLNAFSVSMLLGITWIFGFLAIDEVRFAFQLIFCICNSFQGVMIFILFCLAQKDVRRLLGEKFRSKSSSKSKPTNKQKQLVMRPVKARNDAPVTSISDSTRVSGESYSEDGDTVVTNLDNDTMTMNTMHSSELSD